MCYKETKCSLGVWVHLAVLLSRGSSQQSRLSFSSRPEKRWRNSCLLSALSCSVEACFNSLWTKTDSGVKWYLPNEFSELRQYSYRTKEQRNLRNKQFTGVLAAYYTFLHFHCTFPCNFQKKKNEKKKTSLFTHTQLSGQSAVCPIDGENPAKYQRRETESGVSEQFKRRKSFVLWRLIITKQVWRFLFFWHPIESAAAHWYWFEKINKSMCI